MSKNAKPTKGKAQVSKKGSTKKATSKITKKTVNPKHAQQSRSVKEEEGHPQPKMVKVMFVNGSYLTIPICYPKEEIQLQSDITTARAWSDKAFKVAGSRARKMSEKFGFDMSDPEI